MNLLKRIFGRKGQIYTPAYRWEEYKEREGQDYRLRLDLAKRNRGPLFTGGKHSEYLLTLSLTKSPLLNQTNIALDAEVSLVFLGPS